MAKNFKINAHRERDILHLKLAGDFDGTSAWELIHTLENSSIGINRAYIYTNNLSQTHPFGQAVFYNNLRTIRNRPMVLYFVGTKAKKIIHKKEITLH